MKNILLILLTSISTLSGYAQSIHLVINKESEQIQFAAHEIKLSLIEKGLSVDVYSISDINKISSAKPVIVLASSTDKNAAQILKKAGIKNSNQLKKEGFIIQKAGKTITVLGFDHAGAMYGGLELAEIIKTKDRKSVV